MCRVYCFRDGRQRRTARTHRPCRLSSFRCATGCFDATSAWRGPHRARCRRAFSEARCARIVLDRPLQKPPLDCTACMSVRSRRLTVAPRDSPPASSRARSCGTAPPAAGGTCLPPGSRSPPPALPAACAWTRDRTIILSARRWRAVVARSQTGPRAVATGERSATRVRLPDRPLQPRTESGPDSWRRAEMRTRRELRTGACTRC